MRFQAKFLRQAIDWIASPGWVTPEGKLIPCAYGDHGELACELANVPYNEKAREDNPDYYWEWIEKGIVRLLRQGYTRVEVEGTEVSLQVGSEASARRYLPAIIRRLPMSTNKIVIEWTGKYMELTMEEAEKRFK